MKAISNLFFMFFALIITNCNAQEAEILYKSDNLIIKQLSKNVFQHISYFNSETFGRVECNGMIVKDGNETVIFDTPIDDKSSGELIGWIKNKLHATINAVIPTHFHEDCLGGLKEFNKNNIPSYASNKTIELAKKNGYSTPEHGFDTTLILSVGKQKVYAKFFGEGHTKDNVVGYFPKENAMFGGCLIKEMDATKGYLGDANTEAWSTTVQKVKKAYPKAKIVIPGHGETGGRELLDYTIKLFSNN